MHKWLLISFVFIHVLMFSQNNESYKDYISNDTITYVKLMLLGDIEVNEALLQSAKLPKQDRYDFSALFYNIRPILSLGDLVMANFEGNFSGEPYVERPKNNVPVEFAHALKNAGFNFLLSANQSNLRNNLKDYNTKQQLLDNFSIRQTGVFKDRANREADYPKIMTMDGVKIAVLNYMDGIDYLDGVSPVINGFSEAQIKADLKLAKQKADYVMVYFYWGNILEPVPNKQQYYLSNLCAKHGADLVVGSHPKVAQSVFEYEAGVFSEKQCYANFSLGNVINTSSKSALDAYITEVVVSQNHKTRKIKTEAIGFIPLWMLEYQKNGNIQYTLLPVSEVENGNIKVMLDYDEFFDMTNAVMRIRNKLGSDIPEIQYNVNSEVIRDANEIVAITGKPVNEKSKYNQKLALNKAYELSGRTTAVKENPIKIEEVKDYYAIKFLTLYRKISIDTDYYTHLKGYKMVKHKDQYYYLIGQETEKKAINDLLLDIKRNGHAYAEIVEFKNGEIVE